MMKLAYALLATILIAGVSMAADYQPFPEAKITTEQWHEYHAIVAAEFGGSKEELTEAKLVLYQDEEGGMLFAFTLSDHPAHPAWITRKLVEQNDTVSIEQVGYFAGDEEPFADLFDDYLALADEIQSEIEAKNAPQE